LEDIVLIVAEDLVGVEEDLAARRLGCPGCGSGVLAGWGFARWRVLRGPEGGRWLRPRRGRCIECRATHVLLPDACLARRLDCVEVIGAALLAGTREGYRPIAARLGLPAETVRDWLRRARARAGVIAAHFAGWARALDGALVLHEVGDGLAGAVEAIGLCARAASLALGPRAAWSWVSALTAGGLLCNTNPLWPAPE
jgi:hypothetical protein